MSGLMSDSPNQEHLDPDAPEVEVVHHWPAALDISGWRAERMRRLIAEKARRTIEGVNLYEPLPTQHRFHVSRAPERIVRGSNRSGKTLSTAVEVARAVLGRDPHNKYPLHDGRAFCVGKDGKHTSQVMWRKLSRAEAFKMIRDRDTGAWRAYRAWDSLDVQRSAEAKWAPPLIPRRMIKSIAWENKKENLPSIVVLHNGWELSFFSSLGKPPHGSDIDLAWFDEEIVDADWYPEMSARLLDRSGLFIWSATPQAGTEQLYALHERAMEEHGKDNPAVAEFVTLLSANPHVPSEQKQKFAAKLSEIEFQIRIEGEFALMSFRVYPEFDPLLHVVPYREIPRDWTRYAVVDPGRQVCAVLFAAVPPPQQEQHNRVYIYDELYIRDCDATLFGERMKLACQGQNFHAFLIDHSGSRIHETGGGMTIESQYSAALKNNGIKSLTTGYDFVWGADDVTAGVEAVRRYLRRRADDKPGLVVLSDKCPNLLWEIRNYRYKRVKQQVTEKPEDRGRVHLMACMRYLAMHSPRWHKPPSGNKGPGPALAALKAKQKRRKDKGEGGSTSIQLGLGSQSYSP